MKFTILFGGPAGTGPNILTHILGEALVEHGNHVFYSRDYQSLIRGGHNFNILTFSQEEKVFSNESKIDVIVSLDENTEKIHKKDLKKSGIIIKNPADETKGNMYFAGKLFKVFCLDFKLLETQLQKLSKERLKQNLVEAKKGYDSETKQMCKVKEFKEDHYFINGSQGISDGAVKSELNIYYAYPMTPATGVLTELAQRAEKANLLVLELENEIAVVNAGIGSSIVGKNTMVGTSGGGFDLMTEGLSLCGMTEIPLVFYLSQRPGPATGVATYTAQGDLNLALYSGHGEFPRVVLAPGDPKDSTELINQAFYLSHKFKVPSIILGDKHLAESFYTLHKNPELIKVTNTTKLTRFNSYEVDSSGSATENPEIVKKNVLERIKKTQSIEKESSKFNMFEIYGNEKSKNLIISWGSTKGAILDAIKELDVSFLQIKYLSPFPKEIKKYLNKNVILVENNATGQLADLIAQKTGVIISDKNKILKFDGRPFFSDELENKIKEKIK